jgi:integrase/predicted RNase H-like HicB family nuclease
VVSVKNPQLKTALARYQKSISILKKGYEQEKYRISQVSNSPLGTMNLRSIDSHHIATYRDQRLQQLNKKTGKAISPSTVRLEMSLLSNFFDIARIVWGVRKDNPVKNVRKPKPAPGRTRRLTPREERKIMRYCYDYKNQELIAIIELALETAMRQGEILGLQWQNIDFFKRVAHLPDTKNGTSRDVPLSVKAKNTLLGLENRMQGNAFKLTSRGLKSAWRQMMLKLEIEDLRFHDLRHEAVSRLFELSTLDMMEVAAISGHKSLSMLKRYTHLKAQTLVKKLDGNRNKSTQTVLNHLVPYPAFIETTENHSTICLPDFDDACVQGTVIETTQKMAKDLLLRLIITKLRDGKKIPKPDHYLSPSRGVLFLLDPMDYDCTSGKVFKTS